MAMTVVVEVEMLEVVPGSCGLQLIFKPQAVGFETRSVLVRFRLQVQGMTDRQDMVEYFEVPV